ncbi:MAG: glucose-6-phosphate 1-dehydrogenase [Anaerolineaceae bacterium]|nr:glucose-6-phosphate dehydrogenase [Anaerolineae bacterium]MBL1171870.1 glucose-6-phosphate dehydrogenase [Chloroflexota bacterium]MCL4823628.1 glucose-6-phosphate dehydrogenase [Anaerolineales bacterium]MDL1926021.1 glucose-6-phosphate dehydrogenase [Anaerolineae bacterium AMX1]GJQ39294.1 MAG: glucose-6-phosphate 1-dehydrogenase [Anaerolineaceae bacterium]
MAKSNPISIIIFGASGDLTQRKLIPSLFNLFRKRKTPKKLNIIGFANSPFTDETFRQHLLDGMKQFASFKYTDEEWGLFSQDLYYQQGRYTDLADFKKLMERMPALESGAADRLFYMAVPPLLVPNIIDLLGLTGHLQEDGGWRRVVMEKPFGSDLESARALNLQVHKALNENQIYRIDHYLGKETVQNILFTRFANTIFEPIWNRNYIDHVQITVAEKVGVEHRGGYYDSVGVLRDMFQNHLLQLTTLVAMEPPSSFNATALRNEKVKALTAIEPMTPAQVAANTVRAQYDGYRSEPDVKPDSVTPTYAALRLFVNNWRWQGVPFYLRSGKNLAEKLSQIVIRFKAPPLAMFPMPPEQKTAPNMLMLYIQPDEGIHLRFEAKAPDTVAETRSVDMEFHYAEAFGPTAIPEAYERLLLDALQGDAALFTRADETETAWKIMDPILQAWEAQGTPPLGTYAPNSWGPAEADALLARDGRQWING